MPELSQALAAQGSGDITVFVNRKTGFTVNAGSHTLSLGMARDLPPADSIQADDATIEDAKLGDTKTATRASAASATRSTTPQSLPRRVAVDHLPLPAGIAHHRRDDVFLPPPLKATGKIDLGNRHGRKMWPPTSAMPLPGTAD